MDYPCATFGDFGLSRFGFNVRTDRQTDRIRESQNHMIAILTRLPNDRLRTITINYVHFLSFGPVGKRRCS